MAAIVEWAQRNGAAPGTNTDLGASTGNLVNFKTNDDATVANYSSNPITASDASNGGNSMEVWLRVKFGGVFTTISNAKFWQSTAFSPSTGLSLKYTPVNTYATPTTNDTNFTNGAAGALADDAAIPTSTPVAQNVGLGGTLAGTIVAPGYTSYLVLQLHMGTTTPAGDTSLAVFTFQYDEV